MSRVTKSLLNQGEFVLYPHRDHRTHRKTKNKFELKEDVKHKRKKQKLLEDEMKKQIKEDINLF
jgi:hypothetical protein